jgi:hypothetical protein
MFSLPLAKHLNVNMRSCVGDEERKTDRMCSSGKLDHKHMMNLHPNCPENPHCLKGLGEHMSGLWVAEFVDSIMPLNLNLETRKRPFVGIQVCFFLFNKLFGMIIFITTQISSPNLCHNYFMMIS